MKYLIGTLILFFIVTAFAFKGTLGKDNFELAKQELIFRKVGHEILLNAGDQTSRVLPVKKLADNNYLITFENELTFQTDSLVKIIGRELSRANLTSAYIVKVLNCDGTNVQFGYSISNFQKRDDIIACTGRIQPKNCYQINIKFEDPILTPDQKEYLVASLPLLGFVGLLIFVSAKKLKLKANDHQIIEPLQLGKTIFDMKGRQLLIDGKIRALTAKENKILLIFAQSPNVIITRSRLQKEIWEDEGVIVSRSLDVFISRLRKKLENDPTLQLNNIHGKGYKLVIDH